MLGNNCRKPGGDEIFSVRIFGNSDGEYQWKPQRIIYHVENFLFCCSHTVRSSQMLIFDVFISNRANNQRPFDRCLTALLTDIEMAEMIVIKDASTLIDSTSACQRPIVGLLTTSSALCRFLTVSLLKALINLSGRHLKYVASVAGPVSGFNLLPFDR